MRLAVFVSGNGSNLQCIIDAINTGVLQNVVIDIVVADRNCLALHKAKKANIKTMQVDRNTDWTEKVYSTLTDQGITHIVLAGFLSIMPKAFCINWKNRMINLHPALLPKYGGRGMYGLNVHQAVIENKEIESGATVHYVTENVDEGDIILQKKCVVDVNETPESLQEKIHKIEHPLLIEAIKILNAEA